MTLKTAADASMLKWRKSSYSSNDGPECVEVAATSGAVHVRDSKDVARTGFVVSAAGWTAFAAYAAHQAAVCL
jgi:uncharacterized protein DUF397